MEFGRSKPALSDVAALAGVSHQTVSRVVNGSPHVAPATRERVDRAIAELGYRPNSAARALVTGATRTIGMVTHNINQFGPAQTMLGLEQSARQAGYSLRIAILDDASGAAMQAAVEGLVDQSVDAVIALATYADALTAVRKLQAPVPVVTVQAGPDPTRSTVWVDQAAGARLATRHLLELGHRTVHHIAGPASSMEARRRIAGWRSELEEWGAELPAPLRGDWTPASGQEAGRRLLDRAGNSTAGVAAPTAVFAANDQMALGFLHALHDAGIDAPRDVSVVGFDDIPEASHFLPPLTTVRQDFSELGRRGVALALDRLTRGGDEIARTTAVAPELIVRASTSPVAHRD